MSSSETRIFQVDSFTAEPFRGNPAGVCLLDGPRPAAWMQSVAAEMSLPETAFVHPEGEGRRLRWFTPAVEVDLCGHATLATAHVLWETGSLGPSGRALFHTRSGDLTAQCGREWIEMDFPAYEVEEADPPEPVLRAVGSRPRYAGRASQLGAGEHAWLLQLDSDKAVEDLRPDLSPLRYKGSPPLIVTARAEGSDFDFVSRFFAPGIGIDEDPVTGSAHCLLGPFWGKRLGKTNLVGHQVSARGGVVGVTLLGERLLLRGRAVTVLRGSLLA